MIATKEEEIKESLRAVIDPEIGLNIIELGLIRDILINEDNTGKITMIMTTPFCPYGPQLVEQVRRVGTESLGGPMTVEIGREVWDPSDRKSVV